MSREDERTTPDHLEAVSRPKERARPVAVGDAARRSGASRVAGGTYHVEVITR